jgi:hypothetical protein
MTIWEDAMKFGTDRPATNKAGNAMQSLLTGAAVGAAAMFMFDPDRGRRRRKQTGQAMRRLGVQTGGWLETGGRDAGNRWQGVLAQWRRLAGQGRPPSDEQLRARVRAHLGRLVSHSHAVTVDAHEGCVTLAGPILEHERAALLADVARIAGVREVRDQLDGHENATGIPALQGDGPVQRQSSAQALPPALRGAAVVGGSALAWYAYRNRSPAGLLLGVLGLSLLARSVVSPRSRRNAAGSGAGAGPEAPREGDPGPDTASQVLH